MDRELALPDYLANASRTYAIWQVQGRSEPRCKGYSRGAACDRPKHSDECRRLGPVAFAEIGNATGPTARDRRRGRASEILARRRVRGGPGGTRRQQQPGEEKRTVRLCGRRRVSRS